jgi:4-hydroxy-3-methylbut-2-en-1-yl diphosphate reductase
MSAGHRPVICAALRIEVALLCRTGHAEVRHVGPGGRRGWPRGDVMVAGFGAAIARGPRPGDVMVATEVHDLASGTTVTLPEAEKLADTVREELLLTVRDERRVWTGPVVTSPVLVRRTRELGVDALGVALTSAYAQDRLLGVARVVVDTRTRPLLSPATVPGGLAAARTLARLGPALARWAAALDPRARAAGAPPADDIDIDLDGPASARTVDENSHRKARSRT